MLLRRWLCVILPLAWTAAGCNALQQFRTGPNDVFNGEVIGSDSQKSEPSFIRQGFDSHTEMDLTFDPELASKYVASSKQTAPRSASPGTIDTYLCPSTVDFCSANRRTAGHFQHSKLEQIPNLTQDALSQYDFPGGGRLRNYIFVARFESELNASPIARSAMVFLSLMEDGKVEVRVISPSILDTDGKTELLPALFGVFVLDRRTK
jgi:hypothetical protein